MVTYVPHNEKDRAEMLKEIGVASLDDLFPDIKPEWKLKKPLDIPAELSEAEVARLVSGLGKKNRNAMENPCFLGAGSYNHFIPAVVPHLLFRGEFYTAYTPYQAEMSQGTLQAIFEFQTLVCELTGMGAANASVYDGANALAESISMACNHTRKRKVLISKAVHPHYRQTVKTYCWATNVEYVEVEADGGVTSLDDLKAKMDENTSAVMVQYPNFFGCIEDLQPMAEAAHVKNALFIAAVAEPTSLGLLAPPGELGADVVVGEGQGLGNFQSFGGPYLGFMATKKEFIRLLPGRIVGETLDTDGKRGYILTLQAREQHIRREKSTSNICTNEGLMALAATMHLSLLGKEGLRQVAETNVQHAHYALQQLLEKAGAKKVFDVPFYNEFVVRVKDAKRVQQQLLAAGTIPPHDLGSDYPEMKNCLLFCCTENNSKKQIDEMVETVGALQ